MLRTVRRLTALQQRCPRDNFSLAKFECTYLQGEGNSKFVPDANRITKHCTSADANILIRPSEARVRWGP